MLKISGVVLSAALLVSAFGVTPAKAAFQLTVTDNSVANSAVVNDCVGPNFLCAIFTPDANGNAGQISANINQNNNTFFQQHNVNSAQVTAAGSPALNDGSLSLTDLDIESNGPTTIKLFLTNTDQHAPTGLAILNEALSATSLSGNVTVSLQGYEDNSNALYGTANAGPSISVSPLANGAAATAAASSTVINFASPYSITEVATINFLTAAHLNLNFTGTLQASPVPEPASVMLFGTVLAGIGLAMRKRKQVNS